MARGRAPGYDEQRELILERAAALFARRGYPATSMNEVADACGMSKPALYHYYKDKYTLLVQSTEAHVGRLEALVHEVEAQRLAPEPRLRAFIARFVAEYADAQHAHRVLTEDIKFLGAADHERIVAAQRRVVAAFAHALSELRPDLERAALAKPLTMLLFGMINWMFTWLKPGGALSHEAMAPLVAQLFFGGVPAVQAPRAPPKPRARKTTRPQPKETA